MRRNGKSSAFNRFQYRCAEYAAANRDTITLGMGNILCAIAHFMNARTLSAFPSYDRLAEVAGVDRTTVIRNMKRLIRLGVVSKTEEPLSGGGHRNVYKIAFIKGDFAMPAGWQTAPRSRELNNTQDSNTNKESVPVVKHTVSETGTRGQVRTLRPGFKFLEPFARGSNPFLTIFAEKKGRGHGLEAFFSAWWESDDGTEHSRYDIDGCDLSEDSIDLIREDPVGRALELIGEIDNAVTRKALAMRLKRLGLNFFVGEVARMWTEKFAGCGRDWRSPAQLLLRRLDFCYFNELAVIHAVKGTDGNWQPDFGKAWRIALGEERIVSLDEAIAEQRVKAGKAA